jgi:long-chain acyl-CoA synthetase
MKIDHPLTVPEIIFYQARRYGDRTYLLYGNDEFSYSFIARQGINVAMGLRSYGIEKGDRIALLIQNSPSFFDFFFGTTLCGAVIVPINIRYKGPEIESILKHVQAKAIIIEGGLLPNLKDYLLGINSLRHIFAIGEDLPGWTISVSQLYVDKTFSLPDIKPDDDIAVIYTSGTTGKPKGVLLTHGNYLVNAFQGSRGKDFGEETRVLTCLPLVHVNAQVSSFLGSFVMGGQLALQKEFHPKEFLQGLSRYRATIFAAVPTIYAILLNQPDIERYDLSNLTYCISGSAPMSRAIFEDFERKFNARILEAYGLTEATAMVSTNPPRGVRKIGSIGLPYEGIKMRVVDDKGIPLEPNQVGEIVVSGPNVMKGYIDDPAATASAIRDGWLYTGDLGYQDIDGYFFISGRIKEIIIRGGINIYPKEIEEAIQFHPKVSQVAVVGIKDRIWGEKVHACIIPKQGMEITLDELTEFLKERIADFKIPQSISLHDSFPHTGPGKIQKGKLVEELIQSGNKE